MPDIFISPEKPKETEQKAENVKVEPIPKTPGKIEKAPGHTHNPLSAYCYLPESVDFENRDAQERVILLLRKHPITNVGWIIIAALMLFAPIVLTAFPLIAFLPPNFQF